MDEGKISKIINLFFKKDTKRNIQYPLLHFQYASFNHYLSYISNYTYNQKIPSGDKTYFRVIINNLQLYYPEKPDRDFITTNIPYEIGISYSLKIMKGSFLKSEEDEVVRLLNNFQNSYTYIPAMVGYESTFPNNPKGIKIPGELGCYFIGNKGIIKTFGNQFAKDYSWGGFKVSKNSKLCFQFKKIIGDFINYPFSIFKQKIYKIDFDSSKMIVNLYISGEFKNKSINIIDVLISILYNGTPESAKDILNKIKGLLKINSNSEMNTMIYSILANYNIEELGYENIVFNNAFPHLSNENDIYKFISIIQFFKHFIYAYWTVGEDVDIDNFTIGSYPDKDDIIRYRIKTSGDVMTEIFQRSMNDYIEKIQSFLNSNNDLNMANSQPLTLSLSNYYNTSTLPSNDNSCFKWGTGVSSKTIPYYARSVSHKNPGITKNYTTRQLHPSLIGFFDLQDIPDSGKNVALTYSLSICTYISEHNINKLTSFRKEIFAYFDNNKQLDIYDTTVIFDSEIISLISTDTVYDIINDIIDKKRKNKFIINDFGIYYIPGYINELVIQSMNGRLIKPMFIVDNGILNILNKNINTKERSFTDICEEENVIEFVDAEQFRFSNVVISVTEFLNIPEEERVNINYVGFGENYENGLLSSSLYGLNSNTGIRRIFATGQEKSKISLLRGEIKNVIDNGRIICNPQIPVLTNSLLLGQDNKYFKNSILVRVLIGSYSCENQEDGVIVNTNFIKSGGFDVILLKKENIVVDNSFFNTSLSNKNIPASYSKLNKEGYVDAGTILTSGDSYCKNLISPNYGGDNIYNNNVMDRSVKYKSEIAARVERIYVKNSIKEINIKLLLVSHIGMNLGCKVTNQSAQKATVTFHRKEKELPYNSVGERPDIIVNNISVLSRKTISLYKTTALLYSFILSPFSNGVLKKIRMESFDKKLIENVYDFFQECAKEYYQTEEEVDIGETMYNPYTFKPYADKMFFTIIDLARLKHIAEEKIIVVNRANKSKLSGQAVEGKSKGGGQRFGEMERNCLMCHGASNLISNIFDDREEDTGDKYVCKLCGDFIKIEKNELYTKKYCERCTNLQKDTFMEKIEYRKASVIKKEILNSRGIKTVFCFDDSKNKLKYFE